MQECHLAYRGTIKLSRVVNIVLTMLAKDKQQAVTLIMVFLEPELACNIISNGKLKRQCFRIVTCGAARFLKRCSNGEVAFDVSMKYNVLHLRTVAATRDSRLPSELLMAILTPTENL